MASMCAYAYVVRMLAVWSLGLGCAQAQVAATIAPMETHGAPREFEVASVRENRSDAKPYSNLPMGPGPQTAAIGDHFIATNQVLLGYIVFAFKPTMYQIQQFRVQMPEWTRGLHYDIQGRTEGSPNKDEYRVMMQALLVDRFKLKVHHETREVPVYALMLAKPGRLGPALKLHPADDPECLKSVMMPAVAGAYPASCGAVWQSAPRVAGNVGINGSGVSPVMLAPAMAGTGNLFDRPVIDATGLTGTYDLTLEFAPENSAAADVAPTGLSFAEAMREQLGLKLVPQKGSVDVIVIDHLERPSEN